MRTMLRWCPPFIAAGVLVFALSGVFRAEEADATDTKALDKKISAVVKTVINRGADMFNVYRDYAGCYRYYQGSLTTLRGMLDHHPDLQKAIDAGLAEAERTASMTQRAFVLRRALGAVWVKFNPKAKPVVDRRPEDKPVVDKPPTDKKPADKPPPDLKPADKPVDKPPTDKKPADKPPADKKPADKPNKDVPKDLTKDVKVDDKPATDKPDKKVERKAKVRGKVIFKGKPLPGGDVVYFPAKGSAYVAEIKQDGTYELPALPEGAYKVAVDTGKLKPAPIKDKLPKDKKAETGKYVAIPVKYADPKTSGLTADVQAGENIHDISLQ